MRQVLSSAFAVALLIGGGLAGCSGADEHPLGGPYGGSGGAPNPSHGNGSGGSTDPGATGDDAGDPGTTPTDDSGTAPPPGVDSGTRPPPSGHDSGTNPSPAQDSGTQQPPPQQNAPTWSHIYGAYFASGTVGSCPDCHGSASSASGMYTWMKGKGYIGGTTSAIVSTSRSDISWFGGSMPPSGPSSNPSAVSDMKAWVAAGALNN